MGEAVWHEFVSGGELADELAETVAQRLDAAIHERGAALIAVSGGTTPGLFFRALSRKKIDWRRVTVTLVDERFVPPSSQRSNARLVTQNLLQAEAARADFVGLQHPLDSVDEAAEKADQEIGTLSLPIDVVVLGMGTDGHTASFFPDAEDLASLLAESERRVLPVHAPSAGEPRLTLSSTLLSGARFVVLHIEGARKREVLEAALGEEKVFPVRRVVEQATAPVHVYWAPDAPAPVPEAPAP